MRIVVSGATGFIGGHVVRALLDAGHEVRALVRSAVAPGSAPLLSGAQLVVAGTLEAGVSVAAHLGDADAVVHLAARVHRMHESAEDALAEYRRENAELTRSLAEDALAAGVKHFVFLSSIKVNGEKTSGEPFTIHSRPAPEDPYGVSKLEAENALKEMAEASSLSVTSIRIPMVYGPGNKGNVQRLLRAVKLGLPMPFGSIHNKRTMVAVANVADAVLDTVQTARPLPHTLRLVADAESVSTAELYDALGVAAGRKAHILPFPVRLLRLGAGLLGRGNDVDRLSEDLEVTFGSTDPRSVWVPPVSFQQGVQALGK